MMTKKALLVLALPFSLTTVFARTQEIPKAVQDLKLTTANVSKYVLKDAKGTIMGPTSLFSARPENWFNLSPADGAEGVRTEETYVTFGMPQSEDIIVAVVDSGVDVNHEDLQGKIWINKGEVPNDGLDNDGNGYVDDVFGWNFIGGKDGMATIIKDDSLPNGYRLVKGNPAAQVDKDLLEVTRELIRMKKLKTEVEQLGESLTPAQAEYLAKLDKEVNEGLTEAKEVVTLYQGHLKNYQAAESVLKEAGLSEITLENVRALESTDAVVLEAKKTMINLLSKNITLVRIGRILEAYGDRATYFYNENFDPRSIVGDNYLNPNERIYGNNNVMAGDHDHGTHVSGIIAAVRDNKLGVKGVATNVKIMAVRVVPNGDERDKDVANGIRYAVDNGARIINMSFGKAYSPYKRVVDEAVKYAESKGVLLMHAAGNDNKDNDQIPGYPTRTHRRENRDMNNWMEICATSYQKGLTLPADFTNFGKKTVDLCAPGVDILSTTPENTYDTYSGTSMATPAAAGVAALLLSYDPSMDADAVKALMIDTSRRYPKLKVLIPGTKDQTLFSNLSTYGSIVDAFESSKALK